MKGSPKDLDTRWASVDLPAPDVPITKIRFILASFSLLGGPTQSSAARTSPIRSSCQESANVPHESAGLSESAAALVRGDSSPPFLLSHIRRTHQQIVKEEIQPYKNIAPYFLISNCYNRIKKLQAEPA